MPITEASNRFADAATLEQLVYQLVGAGSTCWGNLKDAGIFDDTEARAVAKDGFARLHQLLGLPPP